MSYDILVLGSGPAGLAAAVAARGRGKSVLVIGNRWQDSPLARAERVDNYLGLPASSGKELLAQFYDHAVKAGADFVTGRAVSMMVYGGVFATVGSQVYDGKALILAPGVQRQAKYPGEETYLGRGVSYCATCDGMLYRGKPVAVVGRSGGGKSTLLRLLAGLETPTAGDVLAGTTPLAEIQEDTRMMFQDARLLPWKSVIDNVGLGLKGQWRDAARRALAAVGLENRAGEWPAALSGGQKQRVALARALIHRPGLLLLDEPLGALDALTRLEMQDLIVSLWQEHGFTVLLVTHDVSEAVAMADRVLLIEEGKIGLDLTVDIPRPRRLGSVRLAELEAEVLQRVMQRGESETRLRKQG